MKGILLLSADNMPQVRIEPASRLRRISSTHWRAAWNIENHGDQLLVLESAWLPHGRFRAREKQLGDLPLLLPHASVQVEFDVACDETPGAEIENAFLILRVLWTNQLWRIFARLRIVVDAQGEPRAITELITTQAANSSS